LLPSAGSKLHMRLAPLAATLVAASIITISPAFGVDQHELLGTFVSRACTPEAQQCLEKLQALLYPGGSALRRTAQGRAPLMLPRGVNSWHGMRVAVRRAHFDRTGYCLPAGTDYCPRHDPESE
jgi:hypothetical protein